MGFITIISEDERFEKKIGDTTFELRRFSTETYRKIKKKHTKQSWQRDKLQTKTDDEAIEDDILDYIITGWDVIEHPITREHLECKREIKLLLPGSVKNQIIEACDTENIVSKEKKSE